MKLCHVTRSPLLSRGLLYVCAFLVLTSIPAGAERGLEVIAKDLGGENAEIGKQYAVFIAVDRYREWLPLKNPVADARALQSILTERYYMDEVIELYDDDATKAGIARLFGRLIEETRPEDSVFIYYAGHGQLDTLSQTGFWIPVDGGTDQYEQQNWISNQVLRGYMGNMKARHVALFSDSCFSGDILNPTRSASPTVDDAYFKRAFDLYSRQVLTSGASETVPDASEFSRQLKMVLESNSEPYLDPFMIFDKVRRGVSATTPLYGNLKDSGHQTGGSFLFFLKDGDAVGSRVSYQSGGGIRVVKDLGTLRVDVWDGGELYLDGERITDISDDRGVTLENVEEGEYTLEIRYGSHREERRVTVEKDKTTEVLITYERDPRFTLAVDPGMVGLSVLVDGKEEGTTPCILSIPAGTREVSLRGEWVSGVHYTITGDSRTTRSITETPPVLGAALWDGEELPRGTEFRIDGMAAGELEKRLFLSPGAHTLKLQHEVIQDVSFDFTVSPRVVTRLAPEIPYRTGSFEVTGLPEGTRVRVDGGNYPAGDDGTASGKAVIGTYAVRYQGPYGGEAAGEVRIQEDSVSKLEAPAGVLKLTRIPAGAQVDLNGIPVDTGGRTEMELRAIPGTVRVRVSGPYMDEWRGESDIVRDETALLALDGGLYTRRENLAKTLSKRSRMITGGWTGTITGALGTALAVYAYMHGQDAYSAYQSADTVEAATAARGEMDRTLTLFNIGAWTGGGGLVLGPLLWMLAPDTASEREEYTRVDAEIRRLGGPHDE